MSTICDWRATRSKGDLQCDIVADVRGPSLGGLEFRNRHRQRSVAALHGPVFQVDAAPRPVKQSPDGQVLPDGAVNSAQRSTSSGSKGLEYEALRSISSSSFSYRPTLFVSERTERIAGPSAAVRARVALARMIKMARAGHSTSYDDRTFVLAKKAISFQQLGVSRRQPGFSNQSV